MRTAHKPESSPLALLRFGTPGGSVCSPACGRQLTLVCRRSHEEAVQRHLRSQTNRTAHIDWLCCTQGHTHAEDPGERVVSALLFHGIQLHNGPLDSPAGHELTSISPGQTDEFTTYCVVHFVLEAQLGVIACFTGTRQANH